MSKQTKQPQIYIRNKDLLVEIHKSKLSYCYYEDDDYAQQDIIVKSYEELEHEDVIKNGKINRAKRLTERGKQELKDQGKPAQAKSYVVSPDTIADHEVVIRIMTSKHIPLDPHRKRRGTGENAAHKRTNFLPFIHVKLIDGKYVEGLRSHWKGGFDEGEFDMEHGQLTDNLCKMFQLLITRYSRRPNWRNYTYLDEMQALSLFQLIQEGLRFNEAVGDNPFSFYTSVLTNCFTKVFNIEKNNQMIRDDLLIMAGVSPSFTRQVDQEYERDHVTSPSDVTIVFKADDDSEMDFDESNVEQVIDFEDEEYEVEEEIEEVIEKPKKKEKKIDRRRKENKNNNNEFLVFK